MYKKYIDNEQMNFQMNRFLEPYYNDEQVQKEAFAAGNKIKSLSEWFNVWLKLGDEKNENGQYGIASAYYQLANFFVPEDSPQNSKTYELFKTTFYKSIDNHNLKRYQVPYENGYLPVVTIEKPNASNWLVFNGGFDSYLEELIRISHNYLKDLSNYNILLFEGPGQGQPMADGIYLTYQWEKPVGAILDFFNLKDVSLMGMSLGGYLAIRAAAFEPRIKNVIAFDTFYSMFDALIGKRSKDSIPEKIKILFEKVLAGNSPESDNKFNQLLTNMGKNNIDLDFKLTKAQGVYGIKSYSKIVRKIAHFTLKGIEDKVKQNTLLLAGNEDMYVPTYRTGYLQERLVNAAQIETHIFTKEQGGQYHCQVGNKIVAFQQIIPFLKLND